MSRLLLWVFLAFTIFYAGLTRGYLISTDEVQAYEATRDLWRHGRPSVSIREVNNSVLGRDGQRYGVVASGQSLAALPLYALGRTLELTLPLEPLRVVAGAPRERNGVIFSGEPQLFCVNLFNAGVLGALMAVYLAFSLRLGTPLGWALAATVMVGTSIHLVGFSTGFFTQPIEALGMLAAFFFLYCQRPGAAALTIAVMLACRYASLVAVPALVLYRPRGRLFLGLAAGVAVHHLDQFWKFGTLRETSYASLPLDNPLVVGLAGLLASPGASVFLYTPLLLLLPWVLLDFARRHRREAGFVVLQATVYLLFFASFRYWHGQYCFGPRYLAPLGPVLLLGLGDWLSRATPGQRFIALLLTGLGWIVQVAHVGVDFWQVILTRGWDRSYAFLWQESPIIAHLQALGRRDWWLPSALIPLWLLLVALAAWRVAVWVGREDVPVKWGHGLAAVLAFTVAVYALDPADQDARLMQLGRSDPAWYRIVLQRDPGHLGALYQLAVSTGSPEDWQRAWLRALELRDQDLTDLIRPHLAEPSPTPPPAGP